ncbi:MAG: hypothetical protein AB7G11_05665 [Phycisphaerales bacterium]
MFEHIRRDADITIEFRGITFNQRAVARPMTTLQHLSFAGNDKVLGCAGDPGLLATYNTMDPNETLRGRMTKRNGRPGILGDSSAPRHASVRFWSDEHGAVNMKAVIPYHLFKHADDPWLTANPGDFVEPYHFHIEFECESESAASEREKNPPPPPKPSPKLED